ncbi:MAG: HD domain-containing phosphohydrolase [Candidatus Latescibacterota bacterium]
MLRTSEEVRRPGAPARRPLTGRPPVEGAGNGFADADPLAGAALPLPVTAPPPAEVAADRHRLEHAAYERLSSAAAAIFTAATGGGMPDEKELLESLRQALTRLRVSHGLLAETVSLHHKASRGWPQRAANTALLAMRLGLEIEYEERPCLALGLCALMHDLGMTRVPEELLTSSRLTPGQLEVLRQHPAESQRIVTGFGAAFAWIGKIVVQVHERQDGSGYPHGLRGNQIHEMARIIGLADTYEAMAHPRADRKARVTYHALKEIIDLRNTLFERPLIKALIHIVSIFPLGSLVKLNNGDVGRVITTSRTHPTRPILEILLDARGRRHDEPRELDLEQEPMLYIVDPAIEEDVLDRGEDERAG